MQTWTKDLKWSAAVFEGLVWPILNQTLPGRIVHVETITTDEFAKDLDRLAGVDAWHIMDKKGIRGIASRVQECPPPKRPYDTFTIRRSRDTGAATEYEKRKQAIEGDQGLLYPHLTVQSYVTQKRDGDLLSFGVALTRDVISRISEWIEQGQPAGCPVWINRTTNATFYVVRWTDDLLKFRYP